MGVTKKNKDLLSSALSVSKAALFRKFLSILQRHTRFTEAHLPELNSLNKIQYDYVKSKSKIYFEKWQILKDSFFKVWTVKPKMWNFTVEDI